MRRRDPCSGSIDRDPGIERFDVAISRFGTMFFDDPVAAFSNIRRALRGDGRLVTMVWQRHHRNEWAMSIERTLAPMFDAALELFDAAFEFVSGFAIVQETTAGLDVIQRQLALNRLRDLLAAHLRTDGVWFDSRAWIVAARAGGRASAC